MNAFALRGDSVNDENHRDRLYRIQLIAERASAQRQQGQQRTKFLVVSIVLSGYVTDEL